MNFQKNSNIAKFSLAFLTENKIWPLLDPKPNDDLLSDSCSFTSYFDSWPATAQKKTTKSRPMLAIYNPATNVMRAFELEIANKLKKKGIIKEDDPFEGVRLIQENHVELAMPPQYNPSRGSKLLGVTKSDKDDSAISNHTCFIMDSGFIVFDTDAMPKYVMDGIKTCVVRPTRTPYTYLVCDQAACMKVYDIQKETETILRIDLTPGFYMVNINTIMNGTHDMFKITSSAAGKNIDLSHSNFSDRFAFFKNNSAVEITPELHTNVINFMGISSRSEYLIWREHRGFFSALNRNGQIQTWSIATGNKLYNLKTENYEKVFKNFEIYSADGSDKSYHGNHYNFGSSSKSLIVSKTPLLKFEKAAQLQEYEQKAMKNHRFDAEFLNPNIL